MNVWSVRGSSVTKELAKKQKQNSSWVNASCPSDDFVEKSAGLAGRRYTLKMDPADPLKKKKKHILQVIQSDLLISQKEVI